MRVSFPPRFLRPRSGVIAGASWGVGPLNIKISDPAHVALAEIGCNVSAKIWNMPESHAAQPLDYLSQFP